MGRDKSANLNLRLNPELKELATRAAEAEQRTLTSLIEWLLTTYLRRKRYLPTEQPNAPASSSAKPARKTPKA
jgi:hypothetical protein